MIPKSLVLIFIRKTATNLPVPLKYWTLEVEDIFRDQKLQEERQILKELQLVWIKWIALMFFY